MSTRLAAPLLATLVALQACAPNTTPVTRKGYKGKPPMGTPITFAPADELDVNGDGVKDGWWWIPFDGSTSPEETAVCGDGSSTGLAISPGGGTGLLVFFDGGGACWSYETCTAGTAVDKRYDLAMFKADATSFIPCSITSRAHLPPALAGATIVFVPYCTGDIHGGDNVQQYGNAVFSETWRHKGHANVMAYLRRLGATFPRADPLVVAGSSAGGFGALVNYEAFRWYWPNATSSLVDDSGPALVANDVPANFRDAWYNAWHLGVATDPFCPGCRTDLSSAWTELSGMHPADRLAFLSHQQDEVMRAFMLFLTSADYEAALRRLEATVLRPTPNARAFYDAGADHMLLTPVAACLPVTDYVASQVVSTGTPVGLDTWLQQQFSGDPPWQTRIE